MKILLSSPELHPQELDIIRAFLAGKDTLFHLRRYDWEEGQVANFLGQFTKVELEKIVLNHHHFLASEFGIHRLHFSEQDRKEMDVEKLQRIADAGFILSTSVHEVETFNQLPKCFTYAFLSPVFDSISKSGYKAVSFELSERRKDMKLIGLGGITMDNYTKVAKMGFDGVAFLGGVWNADSALEIVKRINELK
jgi:thiamine-phosphate pyrophosphorylase